MCLVKIDETPISKSRTRSKTCSGQMVKRVTKALQHTVLCTGAPTDHGTEMIYNN